MIELNQIKYAKMTCERPVITTTSTTLLKKDMFY